MSGFVYRISSRILTHLLFFLALSLPLISVSGRIENEFTILYVGDTGFETWRHIDSDPLLPTIPVPASTGFFTGGNIRKNMRQYIPRTYKRYSSEIDLLILSDTDHQLFTVRQQEWFKDGVIEAGQGMIMAGGWESFGGAGYGTSWEGSPVIEALPVDLVSRGVWDEAFFRARPTERAADHPFCTSLPWKSMPRFEGMNRVVPKDWALVLLEVDAPGISSSRSPPLLVYGTVGEGSSIAHAPDWNPGWGREIIKWEYYPDYLIYMAYLAVGVPIPQNLQLSHLVRAELANYNRRVGVTLSFLEFVEKFGANIHPLEGQLSEIYSLKEEADELYLDQELEAVLARMKETEVLLDELNEQAIELKDKAMLWVYVVEWAAVSAVFLLSGFLLWTLMIRRRLYRKVEATRYREL